MFIDETNILVTAGSGGDGCMAFRREKYIPMGGPYGGSGGKGGDVVFVADSGLKTLIDLKYQKTITGINGKNGEGKNKNGKNGDNIYIKVPVGTILTDIDNGYVIADLNTHASSVTVSYGGRGGRGNVSLSTRNNPCPSYCERGEPGEKRNIKAELKMIADIGLIGLPSVGKSTILSMISKATPKIASYHFTTLSPNLGVVTTSNHKTFVVADLPGLIEGASEGVGLGHKFLRHVERTKILVHVIDISGSEGRNPYDDYLKINEELKKYNEKLLDKPKVVVCNKMDLPNAKENLLNFKEKVKDIKIFEIEAMNNKGLDELINYLGEEVEKIEDTKLVQEEQIETHVLYKFREEKPFTITKEANIWIIKGEKVEKLLKMTNFNGEEAYIRFAKKLRNMGIDDELEKLGVKEGDIVRILNYEFEYTK